MAVRYRKYFKECKPVNCSGRRGKHCPTDRPRRANGEHKTCGVWAIELFDDNRQWQSLTYKDVRNKTDAEKRLATLIGDRERGKLNLPKKKVIPKLKDYATIYLDLHKNSAENTLLMKQRAVKVLVKYLDDYTLDKITPFIIEKFRIQRQGKDKIKDSSVNIDVQVLSQLYTTAIKAGIMFSNPCQGVKRLKTAQTNKRTLSSYEIKLLLDKLTDKYRLMVLISLLTGMRLNEVLKLRWDNFDFSKKLVTYTASKTGRFMRIPISDFLVDELRAYKETRIGESLFDVRPITHKVVSAYSTHFKKLFKGLGIDDCGFHVLRHSFSSLQFELGTPATAVRELMGHADLSMTNHYSHANNDSMRQAMDNMGRLVLGMAKGLDCTNEKMNVGVQ